MPPSAIANRACSPCWSAAVEMVGAALIRCQGPPAGGVLCISIDVSTHVGLRDRAFIGLIAYSFARVPLACLTARQRSKAPDPDRTLAQDPTHRIELPVRSRRTRSTAGRRSWTNFYVPMVRAFGSTPAFPAPTAQWCSAIWGRGGSKDRIKKLRRPAVARCSAAGHPRAPFSHLSSRECVLKIREIRSPALTSQFHAW
jgi:hypothetical protein